MKIIPVILVISVVFVAGCTGQATHGGVDAEERSGTPVGNNVGNRAPDFTVISTDGRSLKLSDFTEEGKPVLLYFTATWCPFCKQDFAQIEQVYGNYEEEVDLLAVSLDLSENAALLNSYKNSNRYPGTFASGNQNILVDYSVRATTTKYGITRDGIIMYKGSGVLAASNWDAIFGALAAN